MHTWGGGGGGGGGGGKCWDGMAIETERGGGREETISAIDMEDMGRNVNRVDAEKTFQAVFLFLIHRFHSSSQQNSVANSNDKVALL